MPVSKLNNVSKSSCWDLIVGDVQIMHFDTPINSANIQTENGLCHKKMARHEVHTIFKVELTKAKES